MEKTFEKIKYPDGQISAKLGNFPTSITARINSYEDLVYVSSVADVYKQHDKKAHLFIPCLFGQRSDRRFTENQSFDLRQITKIINKCKFTSVTLFDPHSDVAPALIKRSRRMSSFSFVENTVEDIKKRLPEAKIMLVSPDAGAYKKVFDYGEKLNLPVMAAVKHRDLEGNVKLIFTGDVEGYDCLIVDDLCDGGYTFEILGKALIEKGSRSRYLYVSHGYFSKGFIKLAEVINHIYCTNSVKDLESNQNTHPDVKSEKWITEFITQFKIV